MMAIANLQYAWTLFTLPLTKSLNVKLSVVQVAFTLFILAETVHEQPTGGLASRRLGAAAVPSRPCGSSERRQLHAVPDGPHGNVLVDVRDHGPCAFGGLMVTAQLKPIAHTYGLDKSVFFLGMSALAMALMLDRILNGLTRPCWGWVSDHIGRYNTMAMAFALEAVAILGLLQLVHHPVWFVVLSGFTFFAWGEIFSLFPAAIGDVFGPDYATTNYGIQYTAKGTASIFAGWGAAKLLEATGSWIPVLWVAVACHIAAATPADFCLKPIVVRALARQRITAEAATEVARPQLAQTG
jgi:MFS transporter